MWSTNGILVIQTFISHRFHTNINSIFKHNHGNGSDIEFVSRTFSSNSQNIIETAHSSGSATARNCYNRDEKWKSIPFIVPEKQTDKEDVILPGETKTIWTTETKLIEDIFQPIVGSAGDNDNSNTLVALGIYLGDEELMEVASLCEIQACTYYNGQCVPRKPRKSHTYTDAEGYFVTIECIGRIKLEELDQHGYYSCPYPKFHYSIAEEIIPEKYVKEIQMVVQNIEIFMKILPVTVCIETENINDLEEEYEVNTMLSKYKTSYNKALNAFDRSIAAVTATAKPASSSSSSAFKHKKSAFMKSLIATSWAAFTAAIEDDNNSGGSDGPRIMNTINMNNYRIRALDYDNVFDRLKLAQYMLRERQLRAQGMRLIQQHGNDDEISITTNNTDDGCDFFSLEEESSFE